MAGGSGRARGAGSRAAPNWVPRGRHARSPNLCGGPPPLLYARMGALFALLGLVVCWTAFFFTGIRAKWSLCRPKSRPFARYTV